MANILYGINGEGSGHWTRSKEVITHLQESGHNVVVVTSGRALTGLHNHFHVEEIFGFKFKFKGGQVDNLATFFENTSSLNKGGRSLKKTLKLIGETKTDLVITDFEPISCLAGRMKGVPVISIDNQHFITMTNADYPRRFVSQASITKAAIKMMTQGADQYVTLSFFDAEPKNKSVHIVPPVVRREVFRFEPTVGDYILVYVSHGHRAIAEVLKNIDFKFIVYGTTKEGCDGNVEFRKFDPNRFLEDLAGSAGVLATAGFSLISEALFLGKPYLAWPVKNLFEQVFNAYHLERLGYGKFISELETEKIESFIFNLARYHQNLSGYHRQDNNQLFAKLDELIKTVTL